MRKIIKLTGTWLCTVTLLWACTKEDHYYSEFLTLADKYYPGRIDSVIMKPGNLRGVLVMKLSTDPKITKMRVVLSNVLSTKMDTLFLGVTSGEAGKLIEMELKNLVEARYTATVTSFNAAGDSSRKVSTSASIEGPRYKSSILGLNRLFERLVKVEGVVQAQYTREGSLGAVGTFSPLLGTYVYYTRKNGTNDSAFLAARLNVVDLPGIEDTGTFSFKSMYKQTAYSIDTFYTKITTVNF